MMGGSVMWWGYNMIYSSNINVQNAQNKFLFIPTGSNYENVIEILKSNKVLVNIESFKWMAEMMNYPNHVHPGKYRLKKGFSNRSLIKLLRSGEQEIIKVQFEKIRTKNKLVSYFSSNLEADSAELITMLTDRHFIEKYGFNNETIISMFIPNTYHFNWNTSAREVFDRMAIEYKKFWNNDRKANAKRLNLSQSEIATLASIVEEETYRNSEKPRVAEVYLNRIRKGMLLQADPTVIFAVGDFSIKRVLKKHTKIESPYNTYKNVGLPPGPICIPTISSIDAVLKPEEHDYLYFCAKEDFSGYHNFSKTYAGHLRNAKLYQRMLNKQKRKSKK